MKKAAIFMALLAACTAQGLEAAKAELKET